MNASLPPIIVDLLRGIGENPDRPGLRETPERVARAWAHWSRGYNESPADVLKVFEDGAEKVDQMVIVRGIPVYSHCEHHLAPFFGVAHVAYVPDGRIVGLSKLSRLVDIFARRLQVQERLTTQVADALQDCLLPKGAAVMLVCRHLCMESRGIARQGSDTVTTALRGVLRDEEAARNEFLSLCKHGRTEST
jgi:GTP cyclohydrolase I